MSLRSSRTHFPDGTRTQHPLINLYEFLPESTDLRQPYPDYVPYFPDANVALCTCLKCGSTSLYSLAYKTVLGKEWPFPDAPWIHDLYSPRWEGKVTSVLASEIKEKNVTSIALLRDPKERLISAWKSKVACDEEGWATDTYERQNVVDNLLLLAGRSQGSHCLPFEEFLSVLHDIHQAGDAWMLNWHFLPQQFGCFHVMPREEWTVASAVDDPLLASSLSAALGGPAEVAMPRAHSSGGETLDLSENAQRLLDSVTRKEYEAVGLHTAST